MAERRNCNVGVHGATQASPDRSSPGFLALLVVALLPGCIFRLPIERRALRLGAPIIVLLGYVLYITVQQAPEMLAGYASKADHGVGFLYFQFLTAVGLLIAAGYLLEGRSPTRY